VSGPLSEAEVKQRPEVAHLRTLSADSAWRKL
jgi:hypothetical protein